MKKIVLLACVLVSFVFGGNNVPVVDNALYQKECTSCHFGYQPALLSKASWEKVMGGLNEHFGTDASLSKDDTSTLLGYLVANAGNSKITRGNDTIYISRSPYFIKEHRDISPRLISQKEVGSISNCIACHIRADEGSYRSRDIFIPNYGKWK
ncbi:MAG: diheme cytochrome c [Sulfurospirillaceae bacterium]|nr:diheme cytochrome c [Sulfurospirillaceae bacterium]